jgi:putative phosphoesterase
MLIAFISDIHGNMPALEAVVADAKTRGASRLICVGDIVGYGPFPNEVCHFLEEQRITTIIGNYDQKVLEVADRGPTAAAGMKRKKRKILLWTAAQVTDQTLRYLAGLPDQLALQLPGKRKLLVFHGSPVSMDDAIYPSITARGLKAKLGDRRADLLVCGHTHIPFVKRIGEVLVINCSSAGHPVDGDPRPAYALVRAEKGAALTGHIVRFEYDVGRTVEALKKTSLPKALQKDFAKGTKRRFLQ